MVRWPGDSSQLGLCLAQRGIRHFLPILLDWCGKTAHRIGLGACANIMGIDIGYWFGRYRARSLSKLVKIMLDNFVQKSVVRYFVTHSSVTNPGTLVGTVHELWDFYIFVSERQALPIVRFPGKVVWKNRVNFCHSLENIWKKKSPSSRLPLTQERNHPGTAQHHWSPRYI